MSSTAHVMAAVSPMPFSDRAWVTRESLSNVVASHEPVPQLVKHAKRGRKGGVITPNHSANSNDDSNNNNNNSNNNNNNNSNNSNNKSKATGPTKDTSRSERSLGMLTKLFIQLLKDEGGTLDLNMTADKLNVQKRRIYDITNVLEGIDLIEKFKKNNVRWKGVSCKSNVNASATGCKTANVNRQRKEELLKEKARLEQEHARLLQMRAQVDGAIRDTLTNEHTARFAYVTVDDVKKVDSLADSLVLLVSTPFETYMHVDGGSSDLSKPFVMNLEHKTQAGDVKLSSFVVPPRCPGSPFQSSDSSTEGSTDYSSLDDYSSQDDDSCTDDSDFSSSDDSSDESSDESSEEEEEESMSQRDKAIIRRVALEEADESDYTSE